MRDDLRALEGYHSAQVPAAVRLNTNESPYPPPAAWSADLAAALATVDWRRYPDRAATDLRAAIAAWHGVDVANVFAANGSNEVLQTLLLTYAGAGRSGHHVRADLPAALTPGPHNRRAGGGGRAPARLHLGRRRRRPTRRRDGPGDHVPVLPEQPDRHGGGARDAAPPPRRRPRPARRRRGLRPVRRLVGARRGRRGPTTRRGAHDVEDVESRRAAPRVSGRSGVAGRRPRASGPAVPPGLGEADRRAVGLGPRCRDGPARQADRGRARAAARGAGCTPARRLPQWRQLHPVPPALDGWPRGVAGPRRSRRVGARLLAVAAPRRVPAGHRRNARGGRSVPGCRAGGSSVRWRT